jgi:mono/diheme cytochrome c family protein
MLFDGKLRLLIVYSEKGFERTLAGSQKFDDEVGAAIYTKHSGFGIMPSQKAPRVPNQELFQNAESVMNGSKMKVAATLAVLLVISLVLTAEVLNGVTAATDQKTAAQLYSKHCASCHGRDGRAKTFKAKFNHARDLTDPLWQDEVSDERLFNSIVNGRKKMPSYKNKLSETDINSLVAYIRTLAR